MTITIEPEYMAGGVSRYHVYNGNHLLRTFWKFEEASKYCDELEQDPTQ